MFSLLFFFLIIDHSGALELVSVGGPARGTLSAPSLTVNDLEAADKGGVGWGGRGLWGGGSKVRRERQKHRGGRGGEVLGQTGASPVMALVSSNLFFNLLS